MRQETTIARAGTLSDYLYQKEIQIGEKKSTFPRPVHSRQKKKRPSTTQAVMRKLMRAKDLSE